MRLLSPAKINLFLRILGRRSDGYHELASLFQAVDLCDTIDISLAEEESFTCSDPTLPTDNSNLVLKAVHLFRNKTGLQFSVKAHLDKKIPHQAGLGGGSSNAATTLWALNQLTGQQASSELEEWAAELGSDVPFFLSSGTAYCTGRGEVVRSLPSLTHPPFWIVTPSQGTPTPSVYAKLDVTKLQQHDPELCLKDFLSGKPHYFNDLEEAASLVTPSLTELKKELLRQGYSPVLLSGSGSSFFCGGQKEPPQLPGCKIFAVHFINRVNNNWYL